MKTLAKILPVLSMIVVLIVVTIRYSNSQSLTEKQVSAPWSFDSQIEVGTPQRQDFTETCHWFGTVENKETIDVIVLKSGWIDSVNIGDEMFVTKGTPLFTLSDPMIDSRLAAAMKKETFLQQQITLNEQRLNKIKDFAVLEPANQKELVATEDSLVSLRAELESDKEEIHFLHDATHICATADGVFTNRKVSAGQLVNKGDKLVQIVSVKHLRVTATLFPQKNTELEKKQVIVNLMSEDPVSGTVVKELPQRTAEGAAIIWIEGPEVDKILRPGQAVSGELILSLHKKALAIPQNAIVRDEKEQSYVFLKDTSGYRRQPVKTGIVSGGWVEIVSGLTEKDKVVIRGAYELFHRNFNKIYKVAD